MIAALLVFALVLVLAGAGYFVARDLPEVLAERKLERRLKEVATGDIPVEGPSIVAVRRAGVLPALDRLIAERVGTAWLQRLIDQAGATTAAGSVIVISLTLAAGLALLANVMVRSAVAVPVAALIGLLAPLVWLLRKRSVRMAKFEEQFPDALDLMSRAIRAGHAFQTSMGMVADELSAPVGPEFRKTFDQQNYGLPLREALDGLAARMPLIDVRFFVIAVAIQRESGGNLSEILENLGHVVRERFKIRRQVRTHTAHGRFTGYVLLGLPAVLAAALMNIVPRQMEMLFREPLGQTMLMGAVVLQVIGFFWIRQVVRIEV
jgi:tight adherence protein B